MDLQNDFTVMFDNFDLNTIPYVFFTKRNPNDEANIKMTSHDLVRADGSVITSVKHESKVIPIDGYIIAPTRTSFEEAFDTLKFKTSGYEKPLEIIQAGDSRKYTATKQNIIMEHIGDGKAAINIAFLCSNPFGKAISLTTDTFTATTTPYALSHTFLGTAVSRPTIKVTVTTLTGGTSKYVGIGNSYTGQQVQVLRNWTAGDIVVFDLESQKVYVNSVLSDYSGVFPEFTAQSSSAYYYDNLTTRSSAVELSYAKQYL